MRFGTATSVWRPSWERDACASKDTLDQYSFTALVQYAINLPVVGSHQLESRMRETRLSGSEGGAAQQCAVPTPIDGGERGYSLILNPF